MGWDRIEYDRVVEDITQSLIDDGDDESILYTFEFCSAFSRICCSCCSRWSNSVQTI